MNIQRKILVGITGVAVFALSSLIASAHVAVKPNSVDVGAFQTFTVSVPSERDTATVGIRLPLPDGLESVTPTVKPGWKVEVKKHSLPDGDHPYEIEWTGGTIPGHFRDEFTFSAKAPTTPGQLVWKAYQKYSDGSIVSWELSPTDEQPKKEDGSPDFSNVGPYSKTDVIDDLNASSRADMSLPLSITALLIAVAGAAVSLRNKGMR